MAANYDTESRSYRKTNQSKVKALPGILVARSLYDNNRERIILNSPLTVGRDNSCSVVFEKDKHLSGKHFQICNLDGQWFIEELNSRNGTYLNGAQISSKTPLNDADVIVAGNCVFVFKENISQMMSPPANKYKMAGSFHLEEIISDLKDSAISKRNILLTGPSGSGKELAARALWEMMCIGEKNAPFIVCNAARFSSDEQAIASLFGVGNNVFSSVAAREGLIEKAYGGVLFVDEAHNLSPHVQKSLLRVIENGEYSRIGYETGLKKTNTRFVLSSNITDSAYGIANDLLARLRIVQLPSLKERIADIPTIFDHIVISSFEGYKDCIVTGEDVLRVVDVDHYEMMCLDGFVQENVRGIIDLCDRIAVRISLGEKPTITVDKVFAERFSSSPVYIRANKSEGSCSSIFNEKKNGLSKEGIDATELRCKPYNANRELIIDVFTKRARYNVSSASRILEQEYRINTTRQTLSAYLVKWGIIVEKL